MGYRETAGGQGAVSGAAAGTQISPGWGTVIGAGVGGLMGYMGASDREAKEKKAHKEQEKFRRAQNKYAAFFGVQPSMERARVERSEIPAMMSGMTQGAQMGGMIGNMYGQSPQHGAAHQYQPSRFDPQTGEPVSRNYYA